MARGVKRLLKILLVLILLGAIAYVSIVLMVCWKETHVAAPGKDYEAMLVLGAQVKPDGTPAIGKGGGNVPPEESAGCCLWRAGRQ